MFKYIEYFGLAPVVEVSKFQFVYHLNKSASLLSQKLALLKHFVPAKSLRNINKSLEFKFRSSSIFSKKVIKKD